MKRNLYLKVLDKQSALTKFLQTFDFKISSICIDTENSLDYVTSEAIFAKYANPLYNSCAMDGIMVVSDKTKNASENNPIFLKENEDYLECDTGDKLVNPFDAVIMAEDLIEGENGYKIINSVAPFQNVRAVGEDIVINEMVLPSFSKIRPIDISTLLTSGNFKINVLKKMKIGIIPTGDEMINYHESLKDNTIIETNSYMFAALVKNNGGESVIYPIIKDNLDLIKQSLLKACEECDCVIINAGSSAGRDDYTSLAIEKLGEVFVHGVNIKPGKPVILGKINHKPVIGLPGYPVSAYITFNEFVIPLIQKYYHQDSSYQKTVKATLTKTIMSSLKYEEYIRVKLGRVDNHLVAIPLDRGAGNTLSLLMADGFLIVPQNKEGILKQEEVEVKLINDLDRINNSLVVIGSHDLILDIIKDQMLLNENKVYLSSTHVGSLSGLLALKNKETHLAPSHLLDEKSGVYNIPIIKEIFKDEEMVIIKGVKRLQGFIVQKGNPLKIKNINDIKNYRYINRQKGAGTRVLFDYLLKKNNIDKNKINGYEHEVKTHMAVSMAIKHFDADVGMGVYSASKALDLDFIECSFEEYDFVTYKKYLDLPIIRMFIKALKNEQFHQKLDKLGGYNYDKCGEIIDVR